MSNEIQYYMVGTIYGGWQKDSEDGAKPKEMIHEWFKKGEWNLGWHSWLEKSPKYLRQLPILEKVQKGDVLIAKQMDTDFKSTWIKAIGICTEPQSDGHRIGVHWIKDLTHNPIKIDGSYRSTITKMSNTPKSLKIIEDVILPLIEKE